jgi:putative transposase
VHPAHESDPAGSWQVLVPLRRQVPRGCVIYADSTYRGSRLTVKAFGWRLEIVERARGEKGFRPLPKRWVVERTFAWLGKCRRLSKDYEALISSAEAWIRLAMSRLMLRQLAP